MPTTTLLVTNEDITKNTIIGGNVDRSKYQYCVKNAQNLNIKPLLGTDLYNKIVSDYESSGLTGSYYTMYHDYIKEMVIHKSTEIYLTQAAYTVGNGGVTKQVAVNGSTSVSKEELDYLVQASRKLYHHYEREFLEWIKENSVDEWDDSDDNNQSKKRNYGGWRL